MVKAAELARTCVKFVARIADFSWVGFDFSSCRENIRERVA